ncbi:unnamed protein product, partial [Allacma fusca]
NFLPTMTSFESRFAKQLICTTTLFGSKQTLSPKLAINCMSSQKKLVVWGGTTPSGRTQLLPFDFCTEVVDSEIILKSKSAKFVKRS